MVESGGRLLSCVHRLLFLSGKSFHRVASADIIRSRLWKCQPADLGQEECFMTGMFRKSRMWGTFVSLWILAFTVSGVSAVQAESIPSLKGGAAWINSPPLSRSDLRGKVVLVDFWEYTCVNCVRTFPFLRKMYREYASRGLVIVGIHTPEFTFGRIRSNVESAVRKFGLPYPVVMDNRMVLWDRFHNHYWPAEYLYDRSGNLQYHSIGEGDYAGMEAQIRAALGFSPQKNSPEEEASVPEGMTPELYAGASRGETGGGVPLNGSGNGIKFPRSVVHSDRLNFSGAWVIHEEYVRPSMADPGNSPEIRLPYHAAGVHVVLRPRPGTSGKVLVFLDGHPVSRSVAGDDIRYDSAGNSYLQAGKARMYNLTRGQAFGLHRLRLTFQGRGPSVYSFTFDPE